MAQLGDTQLDRAGPRLPVAVTVPFALVGPIGAALAGRSTAERHGFQRDQPLGSEADHLAQECRVGSLLQHRAKGNLVIGHRGGPRVRVASSNPTLPSADTVTTAVAYPQLLHHLPGHHLAKPGQRAALLVQLGRIRDLFPLYERATALEPLVARYRASVAYTRGYLGDFAEAERGLKMAGGQDPTFEVNGERFEVAMWAKNYSLAKTLTGVPDDPLRPTRDALAQAGERGDVAAMRRAADALDGRFSSLADDERQPAMDLLAIGGRGTRALVRIEATALEGDRHSLVLLYSPPMDAERYTPQFAALAARLNIIDYWRRTGTRPDFCGMANAPALCRILVQRR